MRSAGIPSIVFGPLANRLVTFLSRLAILVLVAFHGVLLGVHALDGRLLDPGTSVRWVLGGLLLAGFLALRRLGLSVWWGRKAVVLWLLVVLLHCQAAASNPQAASVWASLPAAVVTVVADASLASVLASLGLLGLALRRLRQAGPVPRRVAPPCVVATALLSAGFAVVTGPRPPPCALAQGF